MILRARIAGDGPLRYRYDKKSGRLQKLSKKAYKAVVAKAAKPREPTSSPQATAGAGCKPGARLSFRACRCA